MRVQALETYADKIGAMIMSDDYSGLLAVRHQGATGENPHYHLVIRTAVKPQAFRVRMKKTFPDGKGNAHMSIVPWDGDDKALSYLFHEDPDVTLVARKGLTDERIRELRDKNTAIQELVTKAKLKASWTLENDVYEHFNKSPTHHYLTRKEVAKQVYLLALRNGKYPPQPWLARAIVVKVMFRLLGGDLAAEEKFAQDQAELLYFD